MDKFVKEMDVAALLGLTHKAVRGLREKHLNADDFMKKDGAVFYTAAAAANLQAALQVPPELMGPPGPPGPPGLPSGAATVLQATVTTFWSNSRIVGIRVGDKEGRLRVRDATKFSKGMTCPVRLEQAPDLYVLTCRQPRWKGKF